MSNEQLSLTAAIAAGQTAIDTAEEHAAEDWLVDAYTVLVDLLRRKPEFHCDDFWKTGIREPRESRAFGAVVRRASRAGYITKTDRTRPSSRSHGTGKPVWISNICNDVSQQKETRL